MSKLLRYFAILVLICSQAYSQTAPVTYYQFNGNLIQSVGTTPLTTPGVYAFGSGGPVGQYLTLTSASSDQFIGQSNSPSTGYCVQFLFRSGYNFTNTRNALMFSWGYQSVSFEYPNISWTTNNSPVLTQDNFNVTMDGIGRKTWSYLTDGNWHHFAFNYNGSTGRKEIWIDGQLPNGFWKTTNTGNIAIWAGAQEYRFNSGTSYVKLYGDIDEIAIYNSALIDRQIYQNYLDYLAGNHYSTALAASVPAAASVAGTFSALDFAPGSVLPTVGQVTLGVNVTPINQLYNYPVPRYKPNHGLRPIFNGGAPEYEGQRQQPGVTDAQASTNDTLIQKELCKNFNFYISIRGNLQAAEQAFANNAANLIYPTSTVILRIQTNPLINSQSLPIVNYIQNSSAQIIDAFGNVSSGFKYWRPTTVESFYNADGNNQKIFIQGIVNSQTNRPSNRKLDIIMENGEELYTFSNKGLWTDPRIRDSVTAFGGNFQQWYAKRFMRVETLPYRDIIYSGMTGLTNCLYTYYALDGYNKDNEQEGTNINSTTLPGRFVWSWARQINTPIGTKYRSTPDFYILPDFWYLRQGVRTLDFSGPALFHGWKWIAYCRATELAIGDDLYTPFVAAGWWGAEEKNVRPAQWLGLNKVLGVSGAESYYSMFFNLGSPYPNSPNWIWQIPTPAYAQALSSRYEPLLRHSTLMPGDAPVDYTTGDPGYAFYTGDIQKLVVIRKDSTVNKYIISGNLNPIVNTSANVPDSGLATITLAGTQMNFYIRRQGNTYYYDNTVSPAIFYQLDKWHEKTHPYYWTRDFYFEGEVNDTASAGFSTKTFRPSGTAIGNYATYTTHIQSNAANDSVQFRLTPRVAATYYLYVRAKSTDGTTTGFTAAMDFVSPVTINCITDTNWTWYRYQTGTSTAVSYAALNTNNHVFTIKSTAGKLAIDQVVLSTNADLVTSPNVPCGAVTASITPSGATTFCQGGSVTLTANSATSYVWNTGATSQAINVTTSGIYTVTVTISASTASASTTVTVLPLPTATITPSGTTTFCAGGSVNLTASSNSSYLWSTAATTQTIAVSTAGNYTVTVTGANGCTKSSATVTVTVNTAPTAVITAGGATSFCTGGSVTLTATTGTGYLFQWKRNATSIAGATASNYSATTSGNYTVTVTSSGCSATSNTIAVTVVAAPTTANAGADQSVCTDSTTLQGNTPASGTGAWTLVSGTGTITSATSPTSAVTGLGAGANVFRWTITTSLCTPSTDDVTITQTASSPVSITITAASNPFCTGATITFTALPVNGGAPTFQWKKNGINVGTNSPTYAVAGVNGDLVLCVLTSSLVCGSGSPATSNTITESASSVTATITAGGAITFCSGSNVVLSANTGTGLTYQWKNSGGNISGQTSSTYTATTAETYSCVVTNSASCSATSNSIVVTVNTSPTATITPQGATTICQGDSVELISSTATTYLWSNAATTQSIYAKTAGIYVVTVSNGSCTAASSPVAVTVINGGSVSITAIPAASGCAGDIIKLKSSSTSNNVWSTGSTNQTINVTASNNYTVTVTAGNNCTVSASIAVSVIACDSSCETPTNIRIIKAYHYSVQISWDRVPNASNYIVTVVCRTTPACTVQAIFKGNQTTATVKNLTANTAYYLTVQSVCGDGVYSAVSSQFPFKTTKVCSGCATTSTEED